MELIKEQPKFYIYFLVHNKKVVYIGHTRNIVTRMAGHGDKTYDSVRFFECKSQSDALRYEKRWILVFKPIFNVNGIRRTRNHKLRSINVIEERTSKGMRVTISIDNELWEQANIYADADGRTIGNYIMWCLHRGVKNDAVINDDLRDQFKTKLKAMS